MIWKKALQVFFFRPIIIYSNSGMLCDRKEGQSPIDGRTAFPWGRFQGSSNNLLPFQPKWYENYDSLKCNNVIVYHVHITPLINNETKFLF